MGNLFALGGYISLLAYTFVILRKNRKLPFAKTQTGFNNKWLTTASLLAALAALLHAAPIYLPGIGMALSPLSSIPMIIGVLLFADGALPMFLAASALLFFINVEEAIIFSLATGPLGLAAALSSISSLPLWKKSLIPTALLACGIFLLVFLVGLPGLQGPFASPGILPLLAMIVFSFFYSWLFMGITSFLQKRIFSLFVGLSKKESAITDLETNVN
jgi:hypothetical protein